MSRPTALIASSLALAAPAAAALPDRADPGGWVTDGAVNALVADADGTVYAGGAFSVVAPRTGALAVLPGPQVPPRTGLPDLLGTVHAVQPDGADGWYVAGEFSVPDLPSARNLVRLTAAGSIDPAFLPNPDALVRAIVVTPTALVVGGDFTRIGAAQVARDRLAAIGRDGSVAGWSPGANGAVSALAADAAGRIFVGGDFTQAGGATRARLAALTLASPFATAWNPGADGQVRAIALADGGRVLVGGAFATVGGQARARLAAVDASSGATLAWNPGASGTVAALAPIGTVAYIGGQFTTLGGTTRRNLGAVPLASDAATGWAPEPSAPVESLAVHPGGIVAGGSFTTIGSQAPQPFRARFAVLDATGRALDGAPHVTGVVRAIAAAPSGQIAAGGSFGGAGGLERRGLAAFDTATGAPSSWAPAVGGGSVSALAVDTGTVYVGGDFSSVSGQGRARLAAIDRRTGTVLGWDPTADGPVDTLLASGGLVYAGGSFANAGRQPRRSLAAIDAQSGQAGPWDPSPDAAVTALALGADGDLVVAGRFAQIGAQSPKPARAALAAIDRTTGRAEPWSPGVGGGAPLALTRIDASLIVGGDFTAAGAQTPRPPRAGLAALDPANGAATAWNPGAAGGAVAALAPIGREVVAGGGFTAIAGQSRPGLAAVDPVTGAVGPWNPGVTGGRDVRALAAAGTSLWAGGAFTGAGGRSQQGIASFTAPPEASAGPTIEGRAATGRSLRCVEGTWTSPSSLAVEWLREGASVATGTSYTPTGADSGRALACRVTATNRGGQRSATSTAVRVEGPALLTPVRLLGPARVGGALACDPGRWAGTPTFTYAWLRSGRLVPGAASPRYRLRWVDFSRRISCRVRAADATGAAESDSPQSGVVRGNPRVPDTRTTRSPLVLRAGRRAIAVVPGVLPRRSAERPRFVGVVLQADRAGVVRMQIAGGVQTVRFRRAGIARVRVRAAATFLPGLRRLPVRLSARLGKGPRVARDAVIRIR